MEDITLEYFRKEFDKLSIEINKHIANGGSIYDTKKVLPYYDRMNKLIKKVQKLYNPEFTRVDAHKVCGYEFDPEYNDYTNLLDTLALYADKDGFVDAIKKIHGPDSPRTLLKKLANHLDASPSDYLTLMTDYRYEHSMIRTDYVKQLQREVRELYPNGGDTTDIKRMHPQLYEKIRQFCKYGHEYGVTDMQSAADFLGLENERFSSSSVYYYLQEHEVIKKVLHYCPDRCIDNLQKLSPQTYFQIAKCAASRGLSILEWCEKNQFTYNLSQQTKKLAKTKVDRKKREQQLFAIRDRIIGEEMPKFKSPVEEFRYRLNIAKKVIQLAEKESILF